MGPTWVAEHTAYEVGERFEDVMVRGPLKSWRHRHLFSDTPTGDTLIRDHVDYELPLGLPDVVARLVEPQLRGSFGFRERQLRDDLDFHARHREPKVIAVSGATGLVGRQLVALLGGGGHDVRRMVRGKSLGDRDIRWSPEDSDGLDPEALRDVDIVVHLAGEPIGKRFTAHHKARVFDSRVRSTDLLARALATLSSDGRERALVVASAAGYYGARLVQPACAWCTCARVMCSRPVADNWPCNSRSSRPVSEGDSATVDSGCRGSPSTTSSASTATSRSLPGCPVP